MATPSSLEYWHDVCVKAFNNDAEANDFVLFVEGCKAQQVDNGVYIWVTTRQDYKDQLKQVGCQPASTDDDTTWALPAETLSAFAETKRKARSEWHTQRQVTSKKHLDETLTLINSPLDINNEQRLALVREFARNHVTDLGSVPFLRGLVGFLHFQLRDKYQMAEWKMSEYILTQNNEDAIEPYIRLLRGVLGFQLKYQDDDDDDDSGRVAIDMDNGNGTAQQQQEPELTWRMNPDIDNRFIYDMLKCLPHDRNSTGYQITNLPRNQSTVQHQNIFQWLVDIITHCLSFLHR